MNCMILKSTDRGEAAFLLVAKCDLCTEPKEKKKSRIKERAELNLLLYDIMVISLVLYKVAF